MELRVDVDGRRPQDHVSGDIFSHYQFWGLNFTVYVGSFVVENPTVTHDEDEMVITGPIVYYEDPTKVKDTIEVRIPRVSPFSLPADSIVKFYTSGSLTSTYLCPKISEFFRKVTLEIDRFQGTTYPPTASARIAS